MTVHIQVSQVLDPEERFALLDAVSDTLAAHGKRPQSIKLINAPEAGAVAISQA